MDIKSLNGKFTNVKVIKELAVKAGTTVSRNPEIDATDLDGEAVMMNMEKGQYFMMNEVGSRIWEIIDEPTKVSLVIETLIKEFEVDKEECEKTVINFLSELSYAELIKVS